MKRSHFSLSKPALALFALLCPTASGLAQDRRCSIDAYCAKCPGGDANSYSTPVAGLDAPADPFWSCHNNSFPDVPANVKDFDCGCKATAYTKDSCANCPHGGLDSVYVEVQSFCAESGDPKKHQSYDKVCQCDSKASCLRCPLGGLKKSYQANKDDEAWANPGNQYFCGDPNKHQQSHCLCYCDTQNYCSKCSGKKSYQDSSRGNLFFCGDENKKKNTDCICA